MTFADETDPELDLFMLEADELLTEMETGLLALEQDGADIESINSVFRAAHTVKGSAGLFGLQPVVRFTHVVESVLDRLRSRQIPVTPALIGLLLPCRDHLGDLIAAVARGGSGETAEQEETGAGLLARLAPYLDDEGGASGEASGDDATADPVPAEHSFHLSLRFGPESLRDGTDPLAFVRYLSSRGEVLAVLTLADLLPATGNLDPEQCFLGFEVTLSSREALPDVEEIFDLVRDDGDVRVLPHGGDPVAYAELVTSFGPLGPAVGANLVRTGAVTAAELRAAVEAGRSSPGPAAEPADRTADQADQADQAGARAPRTGSDRGASENQTIRVDAGRLDRLIEAVGELVIAGAGAELQASASRDETLQASLADVMRLVEEVRDGALQLRMVPIGTTFSRFQRVVRDVSASLGKDVALVVTGADTEVDKALVEQIGDPLTHLVRNALDHGIEPAEIRAALGKPVRGTLRLNAFHDSGSIVIEVGDDGGGIDPDRVLATAVERGLVEPGTTLARKDIYGLIFEPGFSTATTVSSLSGRGVGMDVVKQNVAALRGTIDVESRPGQGTTMRIRLPLTLAIIDGFLVGVDGATFVIPLDRVVECVALPADSRDRDYMGLRGEVLSFVRLRSLFGMDGPRPRRENVVVVEYAGTKTGLVVDALKGEFQTVIKPLGALFSEVRGIGGSTILGNGDVALIVDVPTLVRRAEERPTTA